MRAAQQPAPAETPLTMAARIEAALLSKGVRPLSASYAAHSAAYDAIQLGESVGWAIAIAQARLVDNTRL